MACVPLGAPNGVRRRASGWPICHRASEDCNRRRAILHWCLPSDPALVLAAIQEYGYLAIMKATIDIPDNLYRRVKAEAALRGLTVREVTTRLYRRWLNEDRDVDQETPEEWLRTWLKDCHAAMEEAPPGPTATEHLQADRNRLESR